MAKLSHSFPDHNQNFWQLTCIQGASQSLPGIAIGGILAQKFGTDVAISSICIGNLILWLIGLAVVSMAEKDRKNAIENSKEYLGKVGAFLMSIILLVAFLSWYMIEIQAATASLIPLIESSTKLNPTLLGFSFGILIACLATGGIRLIKRISVVSFPILLFFIVYSIFSSNGIQFDNTWSLSLPGIFTITILTLPGMVNLPTFFRHSKSRSDSFLALTLTIISYCLFQMSSIFTTTTSFSKILQNSGPNQYSHFYISIIVLSIVLSLICLNLVNIYYSSAALQGIVPKLASPKGYLLIGLIGTISYGFLQNSPSMLFLENMTNNFIATLGVALILSFLIHIIVKHRPRPLEKAINFSCWMVGCLLALIAQIMNPQFPDLALMLGCSGTILSLLVILFFEETAWSARKICR
jgi:purine-cytosine permease-like protein